jgi:hypothetical protein
MLCAVDLAAKFSAACLVDDSGNVTDEWHSWGFSPSEWIETFGLLFGVWSSEVPEVLVIEDVPFGVGQTKTVRDVYRLQGKILQRLGNHANKVVWIPPMLWQMHWKPQGMKSGDKKAAKRIASEIYGYEPPELLHQDLHGQDRVHARKTMEDHIDAFMIGRYMTEISVQYGSIDSAIEAIPRLERYSD